ncbi:SRPBCC domain-containing protein [Actinomadura sp. B10D3]|uniref:SRPBCC domain-containing protein n=1 Tax=Actinomadura sp. B10D3 TaxID=3153557 RepID=UPI00325E4DD6
MTETADQAARGTRNAPTEQVPGDVRHDTFTVSLQLPAPPGDVFRAFADSGVRRRWVKLPGSETAYAHEFRVGGGETARSAFPNRKAPQEHLKYESNYIDIIPDGRIVYVYKAYVDDILRWTSLVTIELRVQDEGTELSWTEQAAFVRPTSDGDDDLRHLRGGTRLRLNGLVAALDVQPRP